MFPRYFLALCALLLVAFVAADLDTADLNIENLNTAVEESEIEVDESIENRNPALIIAIRVLQQAFKWAAKHCLKEAAHHCKQHWKHARALRDCGRGFLHANKGRCVVG